MNAVAAAAPDTPVARATLSVADGDDGSLILVLGGRLDAYSIADVWTQARAAVAAAPTRRIVVDASAVDYCDGGGVAMLVDLLREPRAADAAVSLRGLRPEFQRLLDQFDLSVLAEPAHAPPMRINAIEEIGRAAAQLGRDMRTQIVFIGETSAALWYAFTHPHRVRWKDVWYTCEQVGANALPIVDLKDVLAGLVKTPIFAILIAGIGCLRGLQTQTGASAVGISATRAVVSGIVLLVAVDGIFAVIYYILDI